MTWYIYIITLLAGMFLANAIPHFVQGVSGNKFPTPFAKPPGRGLSSPLVNVLWGLTNAIIGYVLLHLANVDLNNVVLFIIFLFGIIFISFISSINFSKKLKE